jgi:hypothetical protein
MGARTLQGHATAARQLGEGEAPRGTLPAAIIRAKIRFQELLAGRPDKP